MTRAAPPCSATVHTQAETRSSSAWSREGMRPKAMPRLLLLLLSLCSSPCSASRLHLGWCRRRCCCPCRPRGRRLPIVGRLRPGGSSRSRLAALALALAPAIPVRLPRFFRRLLLPHHHILIPGTELDAEVGEARGSVLGVVRRGHEVGPGPGPAGRGAGVEEAAGEVLLPAEGLEGHGAPVCVGVWGGGEGEFDD